MAEINDCDDSSEISDGDSGMDANCSSWNSSDTDSIFSVDEDIFDNDSEEELSLASTIIYKYSENPISWPCSCAYCVKVAYLDSDSSDDSEFEL